MKHIKKTPCNMIITKHEIPRDISSGRGIESVVSDAFSIWDSFWGDWGSMLNWIHVEYFWILVGWTTSHAFWHIPFVKEAYLCPWNLFNLDPAAMARSVGQFPMDHWGQRCPWLVSGWAFPNPTEECAPEVHVVGRRLKTSHLLRYLFILIL